MLKIISIIMIIISSSLREFASAKKRHPEHWRVSKRLGPGPDDPATIGQTGSRRAAVGAPQDRYIRTKVGCVKIVRFLLVSYNYK